MLNLKDRYFVFFPVMSEFSIFIYLELNNFQKQNTQGLILTFLLQS